MTGVGCGWQRQAREAWELLRITRNHSRKLWDSIWDLELSRGGSSSFGVVMGSLWWWLVLFWQARHKWSGRGSEGGESRFYAGAGRRCQGNGREVTGLVGEENEFVCWCQVTDG